MGLLAAATKCRPACSPRFAPLREQPLSQTCSGSLQVRQALRPAAIPEQAPDCSPVRLRQLAVPRPGEHARVSTDLLSEPRCGEPEPLAGPQHELAVGCRGVRPPTPGVAAGAQVGQQAARLVFGKRVDPSLGQRPAVRHPSSRPGVAFAVDGVAGARAGQPEASGSLIGLDGVAHRPKSTWPRPLLGTLSSTSQASENSRPAKSAASPVTCLSLSTSSPCIPSSAPIFSSLQPAR